MDISRRSLIGTIAAAGATAGLSACGNPNNTNSQTTEAKEAKENTPSILNGPSIPAEPVGLLLNHENAVLEMQKAKVDLLICSDPVNVQYLTNTRATSSLIGVDGVDYAVLSSSIDKKPTYLGSRIGYYFDAPEPSVADQLDFRFAGIPAEPEIFAALTEAADIIKAPAKEFGMPRVHDANAFSSLEKRRLDQVERAFTELFASLEAAILAEILGANLEHKTIAIDNALLRAVIKKTGLDIKIVDGERLIRRMRMIKSPAEIEFMRFAAEANCLAAKTAARSIREGANFRDMRHVFSSTCSQLGTQFKYLMLDTHTPALAEGEFKDGRSFLMDAVSTFHEYHGDYGRTVCLGEPNKKMQEVIDGLSWVWDRIFPELTPGKTYLDIYGLANKLFAETGVDVRYAVNPHNVGMHHHDEPNAVDFSLTFAKDVNIELQENMVVSIDMPVLDVGQGGSAHLEDSVLITKDGPQFINDPKDRFIVV